MYFAVQTRLILHRPKSGILLSLSFGILFAGFPEGVVILLTESPIL